MGLVALGKRPRLREGGDRTDKQICLGASGVRLRTARQRKRVWRAIRAPGKSGSTSSRNRSVGRLMTRAAKRRSESDLHGLAYSACWCCFRLSAAPLRCSGHPSPPRSLRSSGTVRGTGGRVKDDPSRRPLEDELHADYYRFWARFSLDFTFTLLLLRWTLPPTVKRTQYEWQCLWFHRQCLWFHLVCSMGKKTILNTACTGSLPGHRSDPEAHQHAGIEGYHESPP